MPKGVSLKYIFHILFIRYLIVVVVVVVVFRYLFKFVCNRVGGFPDM